MNWQTLVVGVLGLSIGADAPKEDVQKELAMLKGNWTVTSYERDTKQLPADKAKEIKFGFADDKFNLLGGIGFTGGKVTTVKLDPTKKPKTIDITPVDGKNQGKTFEGIYQLDGDKLKICVAAPGKERPKDFATKAGASTILVGLQRDKP